MGVPAGAEKARFVRAMFDAISTRYDLMNRLMTGGQDEAWRRRAAGAVLPETVRTAVDFGAGTGDLSFALARAAPVGHVVSLDVSAAMLRLADAKRRERGLGTRVQPVLGDAMALPLATSSVDAVVSGFTLRNVDDVDAVFRECHRVLRPGGRAAMLELTPVKAPLFGPLFRLYFHRIVPLLGALVSGQGYAYRYLPQSVVRFPDAETLAGMLRRAGFTSITFRTLAFGTVALHVAEKAEPRRSSEEPGPHPRFARPLPEGEAGRAASDTRVARDYQREASSAEGGTRRDGALVVREVHDAAEWDALLAALPNAHLLQSWSWGELRRATNWTPRRLAFARDGMTVAAATVIRRPLPFTGWGFAYCPKGPVLDYRDQGLLEEALAHLAAHARRTRSVFLKADPDVEAGDRAVTAAFRAAGFVPSSDKLQSTSTVLVDLRGGDETLLGRMGSTWRRYIRKTGREGVVVRAATAEEVPVFYAIHKETAERDRFIPRPSAYYERVYWLLHAAGMAELFLAEVDGKAEGALFAARFGKRAWYLYGATSAVAQKRHAMYLLQWHTMRWARDHGCETYDMWGAADDPADERDPLHGVTYLKMGFGGRHVRWIGVYDYVVSPLLYRAWNAALPRALAVWRRLKGEHVAGAAAVRPPASG